MAVDDDARWSNEQAETSIRLGKRYELAGGHVEIALARGTWVLVEGPAAWQFDSDQHLQLHGGRVAARVPRAAAGFTVNTPTASIVDLGTEFAVEVDPTGATSLAVLRGAVEFSRRESAAEQPRRSTESLRVSAGQGIRVSRQDSGFVAAQVADIDSAWAKRALSREGISRKGLSPTARSQTALSPSRLAGLSATQRVTAFQADPGAVGNQGYFHGGLGLDFDVNDPIRVYSLGVFDHLGDGIDAESVLSVQLWQRDQGLLKDPDAYSGSHVVAELTFSTDSAGDLWAGYRYKPLDKPIELLPGKYSVVAYGFSEKNRNFNSACGLTDDPHVKLEGSNGVLSAVESRFTFAGPGTYPEVFLAASLYLAAGSFEYCAARPERRLSIASLVFCSQFLAVSKLPVSFES